MSKPIGPIQWSPPDTVRPESLTLQDTHGLTPMGKLCILAMIITSINASQTEPEAHCHPCLHNCKQRGGLTMSKWHNVLKVKFKKKKFRLENFQKFEKKIIFKIL